MWYGHKIEYYTAIKRNEIQTIHATMQMNLKNIILGNRNQSGKATYYITLSI